MTDGTGRSVPDTTSDVEVGARRVAPACLPVLHDEAAAIATEAKEARDTIDAITAFVRDDAAPPAGRGIGRAGDDPLMLREIAALMVMLHAAEAVLARATRRIDDAVAARATTTDAAIALAEARVLVTEIVQAARAKRSELTDTPTSSHRPIHPTRWTLHAIGNYVVNGAQPPLVADVDR